MSIALIAFLAASTAPSARLPAADGETMDPVVAEVIAHASSKALNAPGVDWPRTREEAARRFAVSRDESSRTDAIRYVLAQLADGHSHYRPPRPSMPRSGGQADLDRGSAGRLGPHLPIAEASMTPRGFGRLVIRAWTGSGPAVTAATGTVRAELTRAIAHDACGVVIDVATNGGGNMWPMMGGIAPLYDDGPLLSFASRAAPPEVVNVRDGRLRMGESVFPRVDGLEALPVVPRFVAVILGGQTASSGEILALAFRHQRNVRSFGAATAGQTTANSSFPLANGGLLALTTARLLDRTGAEQQGPLQPDVASRQPMADADAWLAQQCR